jgi:O-antigen/teichoic acid export membrane protein
MESASPAATAAPSAPNAQDPRRLVLKNTAILMAGQLLGTPLSMLVAVVMGRYLGAAYYGEVYDATTMATFGFLFVDWGQGSVMAGAIARDRSKGGELLGTSLTWRLAASVVMYGLLVAWSALEKNAPDFHTILFLLAVQCLILTMTSGTLEAVRGLERTDISAIQNVLQPILGLMLVVPVLVWWDGGVIAALTAQNAVLLLILGYVWRARGQVGLKPLRFRMQTLKDFFRPGSAFLIFTLAIALQPIVDAKMLKYLGAPLEVVGWYAAARRLMGPLILPASVLMGALYPTLSRLHNEDRAAYVRTLRSVVHGTLLLAFPVGLSCALFADLGMMLFGKEQYSGAQGDLVLTAPYLFLLYFSMPLGAAIMAAQRQRIWGLVQLISVATSVVLDPILVPWFQRHYGNGGLGVCVATSVSEVLIVASGMKLVEKGTFDREFWVSVLRCLASGAAMAAVTLGLRRLGVNGFVVAPIALLTYAGVLAALGGLKGEQMNAVRDTIKRKLRRR